MGRPLDKQEAILYGKFVNAAYAMFKQDRTQLRPEPGTDDIPKPYELVAWVNMSDFDFWGNEIPKFYGIICRHPKERNFVLAIRGTEGAVEWFDDAMAFLVPFRHAPQAGKVARGFDKVYNTLKVVRGHRVAGATTARVAGEAPTAGQAKPESFATQLERLAADLEEPAPQTQTQAELPRRSFVVTGHSLGSALATLFVLDHREERKFDVTTICTFASPHVGNTEFVNRFNQLSPLTSWRIVNTQDLVPKVPLHLPFFDYQHVATPYEFSSAGVVKWSPACWHSMGTYLHWLDSDNNKVDDKCKP